MKRSVIICRECLNLCVLRVCVQMAGNPDQQEDTLDDQYQEEGEDEVCNKQVQTHIITPNYTHIHYTTHMYNIVCPTLFQSTGGTSSFIFYSLNSVNH